MSQYIPHSQSTRQFKIGALIIAVCPYGVDYYWRNREGYFLTSAPLYVANRTWIAHLYHGIQKQGKWVISFPKWWRAFWWRRITQGDTHGT